MLSALSTPLMPAFASEATVIVEAPWSRASIGTTRPGVAYFTIRNTSRKAITLTGVRAAIANNASIHQTKTNADGVSSMTRAGAITIPAGKAISLAPGGLHTMLMGLQSPLVKGESFTLILEFEDGKETSVTMPILGVGARGPDS